MKKRSTLLYVYDILERMDRIKSYTKGMRYKDFTASSLVVDAVLRNLEVIGEAAGNITPKTREKYPRIPWKKMVGLRNIMIHGYFGVDESVIWEIITKNLPETRPLVETMRKDLEKKE